MFEIAIEKTKHDNHTFAQNVLMGICEAMTDTHGRALNINAVRELIKLEVLEHLPQHREERVSFG